MADEKKPPTPQPAIRNWIIPTTLIDPESGEHYPNPDAVAYAFSELQSVLTRIGGVMQLATKREDVLCQGRMQTLTTEIVVRHHTWAPKYEKPDAARLEPSADDTSSE